MDYQIDTSAFLIALTAIKSPSMDVKRTWDTYYRGSTCAVWNYRLWQAVLAVDSVNGESIDRHEFERLDSDNAYLTSQLDRVFDSINSNSKCLQYAEFDCFLSLIDFEEYDRLMDTLSIKHAPTTPSSSPVSEQSSPLYPSSSDSSLGRVQTANKAPRVNIADTCLAWIKEKMRALRQRWCASKS